MMSLRIPSLVRQVSRAAWLRWVGVSLAVVGIMALCVLWIDIPLAWYFRRNTLFFDKLAACITLWGYSRWALSISLLGWGLGRALSRGLADPRRQEQARRLALACSFVFVSVASSGLLVNGLKFLFGRARFNALMLRGEYGFYFFQTGYDFSSFPSGHANTALVLAIALGCLWPRGRVVLLLAGLMLALSRVVVTAHYLSDALAGGLLGWWTTLWWRLWFQRRYGLFAPAVPAAAESTALQCVSPEEGGVSTTSIWPKSTASKS
jgi:membrane-associated phospholipid phosphatase